MLEKEMRSNIYLKIPALLLIEKIQNDKSIKRPVVVSYRNSKNSAEWICYTDDDFIGLTRYFRKAAGTVAFGDLDRNIYVYKIGLYHNELHLDIADNARLISPKEYFPEFNVDSLTIDYSNIAAIWENLKEMQFDRRYISGTIIPNRKKEN